VTPSTVFGHARTLFDHSFTTEDDHPGPARQQPDVRAAGHGPIEPAYLARNGCPGIHQEYFEAVLAAPDRASVDPTDPALIRSFKPIPAFANRVLRVVHRQDGADIFVVTAHWDRGAKLP
jgi:hypothetical protein